MIELTVRILNTGNVSTGDLMLALTGKSADAFTLPEATISSLAVGEETDITLIPNADLAQRTYSVTLTVNGEGFESQSIEISYIVTGIDNVNANQVKIFPNPVINELIIKVGNLNMENEKVRIIDFLGKTVINAQFPPFSSQLRINVSHLPAGVYIVRMGGYMTKLIKE